MATLTGGTNLGSGLGKISRLWVRFHGKVLRVGFLEGATYPDGTSVAMVAAIQEFGAPKAGIPPRPYFRPMIQKEQSSWGPGFAKLLKSEGYNVDKALAQLGEVIVSQLQESIVATNSPPLSPVTLMLRRMVRDDPNLVVTGRTVAEARSRVAAGLPYSGVSTKPLISTGYMLRSAAYEIKKK